MRNYIQNNGINIVAILKAKSPFHGAPLKITKQTHFPVIQTPIFIYKDFFIFQCG